MYSKKGFIFFLTQEVPYNIDLGSGILCKSCKEIALDQSISSFVNGMNEKKLLVL